MSELMEPENPVQLGEQWIAVLEGRLAEAEEEVAQNRAAADRSLSRVTILRSALNQAKRTVALLSGEAVTEECPDAHPAAKAPRRLRRGEMDSWVLAVLDQHQGKIYQVDILRTIRQSFGFPVQASSLRNGLTRMIADGRVLRLADQSYVRVSPAVPAHPTT